MIGGYRSSKKRPEFYATSLDKPLASDSDLCGADLLVDPSAEYAEKVINREAARQDYAAVIADIDKLPEDQRQALLLTSWSGLTLKATAKAMGISIERVQQLRQKASYKIRQTEIGRRIKEESRSVRRDGLSAFKNTFTSEVEKHILWLEERGLLEH